jgi:hypothetical protein
MFFFMQAPDVMAVTAIIGAITLLLAGTSALMQTDIKKVLAYSTISQIGYMFLALGVGAWSAAIFHFMIHAFFKALLFLAAGTVILAMHHEHNMFNMGGLRKKCRWYSGLSLPEPHLLRHCHWLQRVFTARTPFSGYLLQANREIPLFGLQERQEHSLRPYIPSE